MEEQRKAVDLEAPEADPTQEEIRARAQTDKVVNGANGGMAPPAKRLRRWAIFAGLLIIAGVSLYMRHGMSNRSNKQKKAEDTLKVGTGPATIVEKGLLSNQARNGLDTGESHLPEGIGSRSSIVAGRDAGAGSATGVPPIEYKQTPVGVAADGSLSYAEQRRLEEYKREREAMEAPTAAKGVNVSEAKTEERQDDPMKTLQNALINTRFGQGAGSSSGNPLTALQVAAGTSPASAQLSEQRSDFERQNDQRDKENFSSRKQDVEYLQRDRTAAKGVFEVKTGWLIPAVLEQELNSDLPGLIRALVRESVYDSVSGKYILIPAGSTLIGIYNSHVGYGQKALQAIWQRVIFPDGSSISLGGFEGDDAQGAAGFRDKVDNHWARLISGALLTSAFASGIQLSQGTKFVGFSDAEPLARNRPTGWPAGRPARDRGNAEEP
ncbi:Conjugative transfer protein TrbI (plasmid) [Acidisarcina polymorpha]|uniref:Conjugative transfer protein TrbI n=1 Tax=Acidisarcina polymorpha TaxID=2211140 RepID=A0A2Z5GCH6_9BACT|nr:TrbI/VirB10 family protein [Acidisarcina polymorpha]AXC16434.1 Conjugative transfer protein TrbI [Acidisarcina polymorpha]